MNKFFLPSWVVLDPLLQDWLREDIGRGDRTARAMSFLVAGPVQAKWIAKEAGVVAGLPVAARIFSLLDKRVDFVAAVEEGSCCEPGEAMAYLTGPIDALLMGERVALNLSMRLSGIATTTRQYCDKIVEFPARLVDTRKTTPGMRILEKYAAQVGGAINHRLGLDDAAMLKDNHILAAGGIGKAIACLRPLLPYPHTLEVETGTLAEVEAAIRHKADIIMLDNMDLETMSRAVQLIRQADARVKIEASGNITLERIRAVAETGVDYISTSAPITRSSWLDLSMKLVANSEN